MPKPILILGTRTLAVEAMDLISEIPGFEVAGFVENLDRSICDKTLEGFPVHWIDDISRFSETHGILCALSTTHRKKFVEQAEALGLQLQTLIHPTARISSRALLAPGCFVSAMAAIATHTRLGKCVFVNRGALIGHHTTIGDYCTIQPGANVAGAIHIGEQTYVGMSATIIDKTTVGKGCVIGSGAVVVSDLPDHVQALGVPARITKTHIEAK